MLGSIGYLHPRGAAQDRTTEIRLGDPSVRHCDSDIVYSILIIGRVIKIRRVLRAPLVPGHAVGQSGKVDTDSLGLDGVVVDIHGRGSGVAGGFLVLATAD